MNKLANKFETKCQRANTALENLKSSCLHMFLRVEPFLLETDPPQEILNSYQDMVENFGKITDFIATKRMTACMESGMMKLTVQILEHEKKADIDDVFDKLKHGESWKQLHERNAEIPMAITPKNTKNSVEVFNLPNDDVKTASKKWPVNTIILVTGEQWGCKPCITQRPKFDALKNSKKIIINVPHDFEPNILGNTVKFVPTYMRKEKDGTIKTISGRDLFSHKDVSNFKEKTKKQPLPITMPLRRSTRNK